MKTLSVDLGGSRAKLAVVDGGAVAALDVFDVDSGGSMAAVLCEIELRAKRMPAFEGCAGVGFAFPGIVDVKRARAVTSNGKWLDAVEIDYAQWGRRAFGLPLKLANDASAAICGEMAYGVGQGCRDAVMLMIGTGIGTAAFCDGHVLRGRHGTMGILGGHIAIAHERPRLCSCGNLGCLEAYTGTWALDGLAREAPEFAGSTLSRARRVDYRALAEGCTLGDALSRRLFDSVLRALCVGSVNLIHAYDPELLILSGGASHIDALCTGIRDYVRRCSWTPWGMVEVRVARNPEASVVLGLHSLFANE